MPLASHFALSPSGKTIDETGYERSEPDPKEGPPPPVRRCEGNERNGQQPAMRTMARFDMSRSLDAEGRPAGTGTVPRETTHIPDDLSD